MNRSVLLAVVGCAGLASAAFGQAGVPAFSTQGRWVISALDANAISSGADGAIVGATPNTAAGDPSLVIPATGATAILLTLQIRTQFNFTAQSQFPADTATNRYGNFGVYTVGFGPLGAAQPASITRTGAIAGTSFSRGDWGNYRNGTGEDENGDPVPTYSGMIRGAAPGIYNPATFGFARGFRVFTNTDGSLNDANGNGLAPGDAANGFFLPPPDGQLSLINLLRSDFQSTGTHARFTPTTQGNNQSEPIAPATNLNTAPWFDVYRVLLTSSTPLVLGSGLDVDFSGWVRAAYNENLAGTNWTLNGTDASLLTTAHISFGLVPTPGAAALLGLGGLVAGRRRR